NLISPVVLDSEGKATIRVRPVHFDHSTDGFTFRIVRQFINSGVLVDLIDPPVYYPQSDTPFQTADIGYTTPPLIVYTSHNQPSLIRILIESDSFTGFLDQNWNDAITVEYDATTNLGNSVYSKYNAIPEYPSFAITQFSKKTDIADPLLNATIPAGNHPYGVQIRKNITTYGI